MYIIISMGVNSSSNSFISYTSLQIQNELIKICEKKILGKIISNVNKAECFSILADETI